jgi:hypothetical protein
MRKQVEAWRRSELTDVTAKLVIYEAFVECRLEATKYLARTVHDLYFEPKYEEFRPPTIWSLSNAFTSAFKELEPIHNSKQQPSLENSSRLGFPNPSSPRAYRPTAPSNGAPLESWLAWAGPTDSCL